MSLICLSEQNRGRGSLPPMLKIEQNGGGGVKLPIKACCGKS